MPSTRQGMEVLESQGTLPQFQVHILGDRHVQRGLRLCHSDSSYGTNLEAADAS